MEGWGVSGWGVGVGVGGGGGDEMMGVKWM